MKNKVLIILVSLVCLTVFALPINSILLNWMPSPDPTSTVVKIYSMPGTNVNFTSTTPGAKLESTVTNRTSVVLYKTSGPWSFIAVTYNPKYSNLVSRASNVVWTNSYPSPISSFNASQYFPPQPLPTNSPAPIY